VRAAVVAAAAVAILIAAPPCRAGDEDLTPAERDHRPRYMKWREGENIPLGYHKVQRIRGSLVLGGSLLFGVGWVGSALAAPFTGQPFLSIPVGGPFAVAGNLPRSCGDFAGACPTDNSLRPVAFWLVFDGFQQAAGLAMFIAGMTLKTTVLVRDDVKVSRGWWMPAPMPLGPRGMGLGFIGAM